MPLDSIKDTSRQKMTSLRFFMIIVSFFAQKSHTFVTGPAIQKGRAKSNVFSGKTETLEDGFRFEKMKKLYAQLCFSAKQMHFRVMI